MAAPANAELSPGSHEVIVYAEPQGTQPTLVTAVRPDGSDPTPLAETGMPSLSGSELLATTRYEQPPGKPGLFFGPRDRMRVSRSDGANDIELGGTTPSFDPAGATILHGTSSVSAGDLAVSDLSTRGTAFLTRTTAVDEGEPDWFPDGSRIVFESNAEGPDFDVFAAAADASGQVNLTPGSADDDLAPSVSPDGSRIVFARRPAGGGPSDLWTMSADGATPVQLTNTPERSESDPVFSPDGSRITFAATASATSRTDVYVRAVDGSSETLLTGGTPNGAMRPDWGRLTVLPPPARCNDLASNVVGTEGADELSSIVYINLSVASGLGGDDRIVGASQPETLCGNAGSDRLEGGSDDDILIGGAGADVLKGGEGRDLCLRVGKRDVTSRCKVR